MSLDLSIKGLKPPKLQFGGTLSVTNPKVGLAQAGPFDLRFDSVRKKQIGVGIIGPKEMVNLTEVWINRCMKPVPVIDGIGPLQSDFPGFEETFHSALICDEKWKVRIDEEIRDELKSALIEHNPFLLFDRILNVYANALDSLATLESKKPDIVILAIPDEIFRKIYTVEHKAKKKEKRFAVIKRVQASKQISFFDLFQEAEQTEENLPKRNLRHALKARALKVKLPIQIVTKKLLESTAREQDAAARAWNFSVGVYYKSGGVPWCLPQSGPKTCFVGISFHHFRTEEHHIVQSSLAQAFSSDGEGFAIRGEDILTEPRQGYNVRLSEQQAYNLAKNIVTEYIKRTGSTPVRVVMHKASHFNEAERAGIHMALNDIPIVELVALVPSALRLLRLGVSPPRVGTLCTVNNMKSFLFTSGFMPELGTYPGPHVPQPFEVRMQSGGSSIDAAQDVLNLTRMNWNTADVRGKWPVTLSFVRRIGGVLNEFGNANPDETSFRYFI